MDLTFIIDEKKAFIENNKAVKTKSVNIYKIVQKSHNSDSRGEISNSF